jgi:hypothetical protein
MNPTHRRIELFEEPSPAPPGMDPETQAALDAGLEEERAYAEKIRQEDRAQSLFQALRDHELRCLVPADWYMKCPQTMQALIETRRDLSPVTVNERLHEALRVDKLNALGITSWGWVSPEVRDNYLASIMRGTILIGS